MNFKSSKNILLTGAGFTKNFGAYLASEMWSEIFNTPYIQAQPKIKDLMWDDDFDYDYESIYYSIMEGSYTPDEKEAIDEAVKVAYENIDTILRKYSFRTPYPNELRNVFELIWRFNETSDKSFIFTLNQDLFFERLYDGDRLFIPGIKNNSHWFTSYFRDELAISDYCQLPNEERLIYIKRDILSDRKFILIKLHGSYNWKSFDGSQKMVIGRGKTEQIQKEPLLNCYFEIFKEVLFKDSRHLLIIGYGFGDDHINGIIAEAVRDYRLKIFVISPSSPDKFKNELIKEKKFGSDIYQGISGYFPYKLTEIFPENPSIKTQASRNLFKTFF